MLCRLGGLWAGSVIRIGDIPPQKEAYFNTGECQVELTDDCTEIYAISSGVHAHFLGRAIWTEHYRPDKYGQLTYVRVVYLLAFLVSSAVM